MVSPAVLLFTVSTLAIQIKAIPTKTLVNDDPCHGKTLCFEKPADYPQEAIDHLIAQSDLGQLHRMKRQTMEILKNYETNECMESTPKMERLYHIDDLNGNKYHVVQNSFFNQLVPMITCKTKTGCFSNIHDKKFGCQEVKTEVELFLTDKEGKELRIDPATVTTGCYCALEV